MSLPRLLLISGSLRAGSSNTAVLHRCAELCAPIFDAVFCDGIGALPAFNPDIEELGETEARFPAEVARLRAAVAGADALLFSVPEYAHGLPGSLKNALDWLVGSLAFPGIPVGLVNTSARSVHAPAQLLEIVRTMSAVVVDDACVTADSAPSEHRDGVLRIALDALHDATRGKGGRFAI